MFGDYQIVPCDKSEDGNDKGSEGEENKVQEASILVKPISQFLCFIPDATLETCQRMFVTLDEFKKTEGEEEDNKKIKYYIKYSPAIIFSGEVPAFDVNFIDPGNNKTSIKNIDKYIEQNEGTYRAVQSVETDEYEQKLNNIKTRGYDGVLTGREYTYTETKHTIKYDIYYYIDDKSTEEIEDDVLVIETLGEYGTKVGDEFVRRYYCYGKHEELTNQGMAGQIIKEYESTARVLQRTVATFYNALRNIALIGLLSVLVYIGIRIVLTSTSAQDKAKYKNMLKDWLIALCILFTLHYIMSITVTVVENINGVLKTSTIGASGEDIMMTTIRNNIANASTWSSVIVEVVLYFVLAIYTIIFTIQYLKRTIYLAFLTVIAPLITLTYPLDKIKDNKSQAFDMWFKDYIFFMLIQVVHLLIYYILVGCSLDLVVKGNWVFAVVAIGFLVPAEKIIKKMFGFEKSKTLGAMAAGATGGLIMNAINKLAGKGGSKKGGSSEEGSQAGANNVRTTSNSAMNNALESLRGGSSASSGAKTKPIPNRLGGVTSLGGKYFKKGAGAILGAGAGATGAMLGFAAGVSQGDISAALAGAVVGGKAGKGIGQRAANGIDLSNIKNSINNLQDTWNEGAYGSEYAQNAKEIREFKSSSAYKTLKDRYGENLTDDKLGAMLQAGIKDKGDMDRVLKSSNTSDAIGYYTLAKKCPDSIYYDDDKLQMYLEDLGLSQTDAREMRKNMRNFR